MKQLTLSLLFVCSFSLLSNAQTKKSKKKAKATVSTATTVSKTVKVDPSKIVAPQTKVAPAVDPHAGHNHGSNPQDHMVADKTLPDAPVQDQPKVENFVSFDKTEHNFGNVPEGPQAITEFKITNTSNEPITINNVQASCGCTVPEWTKEPIAPGATGKIKAIYNTQGRPGNISKSLTVTTSKGNKVLMLKGNVEKAPENSVPTNENSMIKTN